MNVATTNHFEFGIRAFPTELLQYVQLREPLLTRNFLGRELGLMCKGAEIPGATFATAQVKGNYMGITQKYAHTRIFTDTTLTFMVDSQYRVMKFFQLWQEYIASGGEVSRDKKAYYARMKYPDSYKCSQMLLSKFDRDHFQKMDYTFINAFPVNLVPTAIDYGTNKVLEIGVTFAYDRYVVGSINSLDTHSEQQDGTSPYSTLNGNNNFINPYLFSGEIEYASKVDLKYADFKPNYGAYSGDNTGIQFDWSNAPNVDFGYGTK